MSKGKSHMTTQDAARIQSSEARAHGGGVSSGSFAARAQSAAARNASTGKVSGGGSKGSGDGDAHPPSLSYS
ncbi:8261_t:CDS:2 [Paraglomus brasilianum]|uniref:8261_t:CDS:1 n=1 Tax=Paraglomus brasilianum TaxID=144538 RepID=A0A9N8VXL1_9GLOM|nr:8261_t:CDS:2 [Paraglomus brasilianum]